jgi:hypothetical protein
MPMPLRLVTIRCLDPSAWSRATAACQMELAPSGKVSVVVRIGKISVLVSSSKRPRKANPAGPSILSVAYRDTFVSAGSCAILVVPTHPLMPRRERRVIGAGAAAAGVVLALMLPATAALMFALLAFLVLGPAAPLVVDVHVAFAVMVMFVLGVVLMLVFVMVAGAAAFLERQGTTSSALRATGAIRAVMRLMAHGVTAVLERDAANGALFPGLATVREFVFLVIGFLGLTRTLCVVFLDLRAAASSVAPSADVATLGVHWMRHVLHVDRLHSHHPHRLGGRQIARECNGDVTRFPQ